MSFQCLRGSDSWAGQPDRRHGPRAGMHRSPKSPNRANASIWLWNSSARKPIKVAAAINQMSSAAQEVAISAQSASDAAGETDLQAQHARQVVNESIARWAPAPKTCPPGGVSLKGLQGDVEGIVTVLDVIRSITRTNGNLLWHLMPRSKRAQPGTRGADLQWLPMKSRAGKLDATSVPKEIQAMIERL